MMPRFTSGCSRMSRKTTSVFDARSAIASRAEISVTRARASSSNCCPVLYAAMVRDKVSLQDTQDALVRVELRVSPQWERPLIRDVAHRSARDARYPQRIGELAEQLLERARAATLLRRVAWNVRELPEHDSPAPRQLPGEAKLRQHPVDAIHGLVDILENENGIFVARRERGAIQGAEQRQVPTDET